MCQNFFKAISSKPFYFVLHRIYNCILNNFINKNQIIELNCIVISDFEIVIAETASKFVNYSNPVFFIVL